MREIDPGVELSSRFDGRELHVLGYCLDRQDPAFREHLAQERRVTPSANPTYKKVLVRVGQIRRAD